MGASTVIAIIQAIPALKTLFLEVQDLWFRMEAQRDENRASRKEKERIATVNAMKQPGLSDEDRKILRRRLYDISRS